MPPPRSPSIPHRFGRIVAILLAVLAGLGLLVRVTIRDRVDGLAAAFYAMPWPVLGLLLMGPAAWWSVHRRRGLALASGMTAVACVVAWLALNWQQRTPVTAPETGTVRVFFQNAAHPNAARFPRLLSLVQGENPDIAGLVEAGTPDGVTVSSWETGLAGYELVRSPDGLALAVRGLIRDHKHVQLGPHSRCLIARVRVQDREMTAVIVDLEADPFHSRHEAFARLENLLAEQAGEPLVVMGDFNTPLDSVHFDPWKQRLQHAFLTAGTGLPETWPVPLPVLVLDHVWVSSGLTVTRCEKRWHPPLDHTGLRVEFAW